MFLSLWQWKLVYCSEFSFLWFHYAIPHYMTQVGALCHSKLTFESLVVSPSSCKRFSTALKCVKWSSYVVLNKMRSST